MDKIMQLHLMFLVCLMVYTNTVYGQENAPTKINLISLEAGLSNEVLLDQTFSRLKFQGWVPCFKVGYEKKIPKSYFWKLTLRAAYGGVDYNNTLFSSDFIEARLVCSYARAVWIKPNNIAYVGANISSNVGILDYNGFDSGSWLTAQNIAAFSRLETKITQKHGLETTFALTLLSAYSRPPYGGINEFIVANSDNIPAIIYSNIKLDSFNKVLCPELNLNYTYQLPKLTLFAGINYRYIRVLSVRKLYRNSTAFKVGIEIKL